MTILNMKAIEDLNIKGKRVLVRCDFDVPLDKKGNILDDFRIKKAVPTIKYLFNKGAKPVLMGHLGRPRGKIVEHLKIEPVRKRLLELLGKKVEVLENLRFDRREEENDDQFAKELASLGDVYINDAFAASHREHASIVGVPKYLPCGAGLLLASEVKALSIENPARPLVAVIGGAKVLTKIKVIKEFLEKADHVIIGGKIANSLLAIKEVIPSNHLPEEKVVSEVEKIDLTSTKLHLPVDVIASKDEIHARERALAKVGEDEMMLDIGPETIKMFSKIIKEAKTIVFAGPLGYFENPLYEKGTKEISQAIADNIKAFKIAGGGDTVSALAKFGLLDKFEHISTGGGAMLEFLSGEELPGLKALEKDGD